MIEKTVIDIIKNNFGFEEEIDENTYLLTGGLNLESIMLIEIMIQLEEVYNVTFDESEMIAENFTTVKSLADAVRNKMGEIKHD